MRCSQKVHWATLTIVGAGLLSPRLAPATPDLRGVGGGGWLHAAAYHPDNEDVAAIGGDNCGVYLTTDGGSSWVVWNEGLANPDEGYSFYVDDLVGVDNPDFSGFMAATRGGIYRRTAADSTWVWDTTTEDGYKYKPVGSSYPYRALPIPFSCIDYDGSALLVAGAGITRWQRTPPPYAADTTGYPGLDVGSSNGDFEDDEANIPFGDVIPPDTTSGWKQWTVWMKNLSYGEDAPWLPDTSSGFPENRTARDISIAKSGKDRYIVVATADSLFWKKNKGSWSALAAPDLDPDTSSTVPGDEYCLSVEVTQNAALFAAFNAPSGGVSGVYMIRDLDNVGAGWIHVGGASSATLAPDYSTITEVGETVQLLYLATAPLVTGDYVWVGARGTIVGAGGQANGLGLYRTLVPYMAAADTVTWEHVVYDDAGTWYPTSFPLGWQTMFGAEVLFHPAVAPSVPLRLMAMFNGRLVKSTDGGDTWTSATTTESAGGGSWTSTGYHQLSVRGIDFQRDSTLVYGAADAGIFRATNAAVTEFEFLQAPVATNPGSTQVYVYEADFVHPFVDDRGSNDDEILFIASGDVVQRRGAGKMVWRDSTDTWHDLTWSLGAEEEEYLYTDFAVENIENLWVPYAQWAGGEPDGSFPDSNGVFHGEMSWSGSPPSTDPGTWTWTKVDSGLVGENSRRVYVTKVLHHVASDRLLLIAEATGPTGRGGLYYLDDSEVWQQVLPASSPLDDYEDFRSLAQSDDGMVLYAGTSGHMAVGIGGVLKCDFTLPANDPEALPTTWEWEVVSDGDSFGFAVPLYHDGDHVLGSWTTTTAGNILTGVFALAVDRSDPDVVYAGLHHTASYPQEGVWAYDPSGDSWSQLGGAALQGIGVLSLGVSPEEELFAGTTGNELFAMDVGGGSPRLLPTRSFTAGTTRLEFVSVTPIPSRGPVQFAFRGPKGPVQLSLYNVAGRRVRTVDSFVDSPGEHRILWDGRDSGGLHVASGVYFGRLRARDQEVRTRVVLTR